MSGRLLLGVSGWLALAQRLLLPPVFRSAGLEDGAWSLALSECRRQISVLAGTVFQDTHLPMRTWFRAMWNMISQKNGISALGLQRILGLGSYRTAWLMLHKLRQAMVRPGRERLRGVVEVDETYWGTMESDGATGHRVLSKTMIIVAAEADGREIGRIRMARIPDFDRNTFMASSGRALRPEAPFAPTASILTGNWRDMFMIGRCRDISLKATNCCLVSTWPFLC